MSEYDNSNGGMLYPVKQKKKPTSPDRFGRIYIGDHECLLFAYTETDDTDGAHYLRLSGNINREIEGNANAPNYNLRGELWTNTSQKGASQPNCKGILRIEDKDDGSAEEWEIAGWNREAKKDKTKFLSLKVTPPGESQGREEGVSHKPKYRPGSTAGSTVAPPQQQRPATVNKPVHGETVRTASSFRSQQPVHEIDDSEIPF